MTNKLKLPAESRMQGDLQVRFGGRSGKTYRRKAERRPVVPSLQEILVHSFFRVYKVAFVNNDIFEVSKQFGMSLNTTDSSKCYPVYFL